jgi:hypothetical protein
LIEASLRGRGGCRRFLSWRPDPVASSAPHAILRASRTMRHHFPIANRTASWNRAFARAIAPRRFLRVLPTRTRPSLFGSD